MNSFKIFFHADLMGIHFVNAKDKYLCQYQSLNSHFCSYYPFHFITQGFYDTQTWDNWAQTMFLWVQLPSVTSLECWYILQRTFPISSALPFVWEPPSVFKLEQLPTAKFFSFSCDHPIHLLDYISFFFLVDNIRAWIYCKGSVLFV